MEMSKSWLDHVPSCPNGELEICQRVIKSFGLDFCLGRRRDKTSAGYKCNFHSEPSSALLPVSVRFIERAFGSESLLSRELTKPSKTTNEREEVENWREDRLVEFFPFIPDALCPLLSFYSRVHDVKKHVWWGSEEGKNRSRIREETMAVVEIDAAFRWFVRSLFTSSAFLSLLSAFFSRFLFADFPIHVSLLVCYLFEFSHSWSPRL